jgi:hypothetical protein
MAVFGAASGPASLGEDEIVDEIYAMCQEGDMAACDLLYWESAPGSELEEYATTCGGRTDNPDNAYCIVLDPAEDAGSLEEDQPA